MTTAAAPAPALQYKKTQGEKTGGGIPYGYTLAANGVDLHPDPVEQEVVRQAKQLQTCGLSLRKRAAELQRRGFNARNDQIFQATQIQRMVASCRARLTDPGFAALWRIWIELPPNILSIVSIKASGMKARWRKSSWVRPSTNA